MTLGLLAVVFLWLGNRAGGRFKTTPTTCRRILALELAGSPQAAKELLGQWAAQGQIDAVKTSVGWDFLFIPCYSTLLALACLASAGAYQARYGWGIGAAIPIAWLQWLAGVLDLGENVALLRMLKGSADAPWPQIAAWCAAPKLALVVAAVVFILSATALRLIEAR